MKLFSNITVNGAKFLAVNTGLNSRAYSKSTFLNFKDSDKGLKGIIINLETNEKKEWTAEQSIEDESTGEILIYGENFNSTSLYDLLDTKIDITFIQKLFSLLISDFSEIIPGFTAPGPEGILVSEDRQKVMIFEKDFITRCIRQHGEREFVEKFCKWCHPALEGIESFKFFLAVIEYFLLTDSIPFSGNTQEEIHENIIYKNYIPVENYIPKIPENYAYTLNSLLLNKKNRKDFTADYRILLDTELEDLGNHNSQSNQIDELKNKNEKKIKFKKFMSKNKSGLKIAGFSLALVILSVFFVMQDYKNRPTTEGMSDKEVVYKFYDSISNLDQNWISACSYEGSGDYYSQLITNIYVTGKMRESIKRERAFYTPGEWACLENPHEKNVFGITRFTVVPDKKNENRGMTSVYHVDFFLLIPQVSSSYAELHTISPDELMNYYPLSAFHYKDIVNMIRINGQWKIHSIINTERKEVAVDSDYYFMHNIPGKETREVIWGPNQEEIDAGRKKIEAYEASILLPDE